MSLGSTRKTLIPLQNPNVMSSLPNTRQTERTCRSGVRMVNFEPIRTFFSASTVDFEKLHVCWIITKV